MLIVGIDPDVYKSGVCIVNADGEVTVVDSLEFPDLCELLRYLKEGSKVVVERSWGSTGNWHLTGSDNAYVIAKKGYSVGRCHQLGINIVEMCKHYNVEVAEVQPLKKIWKRGKVSHKELTDIVPLPKKRTNQEERDAVLIALAYLHRLG